MKVTPHLTPGYDPILTRQINLTVPGMAHFAASGPPDTRCSSCLFMGDRVPELNEAGEIVGGVLRKRACRKYRELTGRNGHLINGDPESCRYYEPKPKQGR